MPAAKFSVPKTQLLYTLKTVRDKWIGPLDISGDRQPEPSEDKTAT
jgi:hypothetical protein